MPSGFWRTDVRLHKDHVPVYPEKCVRCLKDRPDRTVTVWTLASPWLTWIFFPAVLFTKVAKTRVPACPSCAWRVRFRRMIVFAISMAFLLGSVWLALQLLEDVPRFWRRAGAVAACLPTVVLLALLHTFRPPAILYSFEGNDRIYDFREVEYAIEFRRLNTAPADGQATGKEEEDGAPGRST